MSFLQGMAGVMCVHVYVHRTHTLTTQAYNQSPALDFVQLNAHAQAYTRGLIHSTTRVAAAGVRHGQQGQRLSLRWPAAVQTHERERCNGKVAAANSQHEHTGCRSMETHTHTRGGAPGGTHSTTRASSQLTCCRRASNQHTDGTRSQAQTQLRTASGSHPTQPRAPEPPPRARTRRKCLRQALTGPRVGAPPCATPSHSTHTQTSAVTSAGRRARTGPCSAHGRALLHSRPGPR
jgi:hypothetical protein